MKLAVIEELLRRLPVKLRMSLSSDLITNLDRFDTEQRVDVLQISLRRFASMGHRNRWLLIGTPVVFAKRDEQEYLTAIEKIPEPYCKAVLMVSLLASNDKKHVAFEKELAVLASQDATAAWCYEYYKAEYRK